MEKEHILGPSSDYFKVLDFFLMHELSPELNLDTFIEVLKKEKDGSLIAEDIQDEIAMDEAKMKGEFMKKNFEVNK